MLWEDKEPISDEKSTSIPGNMSLHGSTSCLSSLRHNNISYGSLGRPDWSAVVLHGGKRV